MSRKGVSMSYRKHTLYILGGDVLVADQKGNQLGVFAGVPAARAYVKALHRAALREAGCSEGDKPASPNTVGVTP